ncbi:hypothetical protein D0Z08_26270 [Nocardioides immobilis]|uniref:Uncharacterized protein n=1 Tax=Nocardioides immobilis TaxID=2049295 RepID=A0A417XUN3_9ACTN|nr:hypothetical protein [Nocardioides immobilis]RHW24056.1 hypothetical protein D0Z08_26270 [Nocardioides immobilis]
MSEPLPTPDARTSPWSRITGKLFRFRAVLAVSLASAMIGASGGAGAVVLIDQEDPSSPTGPRFEDPISNGTDDSGEEDTEGYLPGQQNIPGMPPRSGFQPGPPPEDEYQGDSDTGSRNAAVSGI